MVRGFAAILVSDFLCFPGPLPGVFLFLGLSVPVVSSTFEVSFALEVSFFSSLSSTITTTSSVFFFSDALKEFSFVLTLACLALLQSGDATDFLFLLTFGESVLNVWKGNLAVIGKSKLPFH